MARQTCLPPSLPPRLIAREVAAAYCSLSPMMFDRMVEGGSMPKPRKITGVRIGWDVRELDAAIDNLPHRDGDHDPSNDGWDDAPQAAA